MTARHIIVRNDADVLSRATPTGPLVWLDLRLTECTEYRYAVTFDRPDAARKCADMQGGTVHTVGDNQSPHKGKYDNATERHREIGGGGVRLHGAGPASPVAPVRGAPGNRPVRLVTARAAGTGEFRRDAGYTPARVTPHVAPDAHRVAAGNAAPCTQADWRARQSDARLTAYYGEFQRAAW